MRATWLVAVLLLPLLSGCVEDETAVEGRVLDRDTQQPIPGAEVKATSGPKEHRSLTDAEGRYRLVLPAGDWKVKAKADGYDDSADAPVVLAEGDERTQDLFLVSKAR